MRKRRISKVSKSEEIKKNEIDQFLKIIKLELSLADNLITLSMDNPFITDENTLLKIFPIKNNLRKNLEIFLKKKKKNNYSEKEVDIIIERSLRKIEQFQSFDDFFRFQKIKNSYINRNQKNNLLQTYKNDPVMLSMLLNKNKKEKSLEKISGGDSIDIKSLKRKTKKNVSLVDTKSLTKSFETVFLDDPFSSQFSKVKSEIKFKKNDKNNNQEEFKKNLSQEKINSEGFKNNLNKEKIDKNNKNDLLENNFMKLEDENISESLMVTEKSLHLKSVVNLKDNEFKYNSKINSEKSLDLDKNDLFKFAKEKNLIEEKEIHIVESNKNLIESSKLIKKDSKKKIKNENSKKKLKKNSSKKIKKKDSEKKLKKSSSKKIKEKGSKKKIKNMSSKKLSKKDISKSVPPKNSKKNLLKKNSKKDLDNVSNKSNSVPPKGNKKKLEKFSKKKDIKKDKRSSKLKEGSKKNIERSKPPIKKTGSKNALSKKGSKKALSKTGSKKALSKTGSKKALSKKGSKKALSKTGSRKALSKKGSKKALSKTPSRKALSKKGSKKALSKKGSKKALSKKGSKKALSKKGSKKALPKTPSRKALSKKGSKKALSKTPSRKALSKKGSKKALSKKGSKKALSKSSSKKVLGKKVKSKSSLPKINSKKKLKKNKKKPKNKKEDSKKKLSINTNLDKAKTFDPDDIDDRLLVKNLKKKKKKQKDPLAPRHTYNPTKPRGTLNIDILRGSVNKPPPIKKRNKTLLIPRKKNSKIQKFTSNKKYKVDASHDLGNENEVTYIERNGIKTKIVKTKELIRKILSTSNKLPINSEGIGSKKFERFKMKVGNLVKSYSKGSFKNMNNEPPVIMKKTNIEKGVDPPIIIKKALLEEEVLFKDESKRFLKVESGKFLKEADFIGSENTGNSNNGFEDSVKDIWGVNLENVDKNFKKDVKKKNSIKKKSIIKSKTPKKKKSVIKNKTPKKKKSVIKKKNPKKKKSVIGVGSSKKLLPETMNKMSDKKKKKVEPEILSKENKAKRISFGLLGGTQQFSEIKNDDENNHKQLGLIEGIQNIKRTIQKTIGTKKVRKTSDSSVIKTFTVLMDDEDRERLLNKEKLNKMKTSRTSVDFEYTDGDSYTPKNKTKNDFKNSINTSSKNTKANSKNLENKYVSFRNKGGNNDLSKNNEHKFSKIIKKIDKNKNQEFAKSIINDILNNVVLFNPFKIKDDISEIQNMTYYEINKNDQKGKTFKNGKEINKTFISDLSVSGSILDDFKNRKNLDNLETKSFEFEDSGRNEINREAVSLLDFNNEKMLNKNKKNKKKYKKQEVFNYLQNKSFEKSFDSKKKKKYNQSAVNIFQFRGKKNFKVNNFYEKDIDRTSKSVTNLIRENNFENNNNTLNNGFENNNKLHNNFGNNGLNNKNKDNSNSKKNFKLKTLYVGDSELSEKIPLYPNSPNPHKMSKKFFSKIKDELKKKSDFENEDNIKGGTHTVETTVITNDNYISYPQQKNSNFKLQLQDFKQSNLPKNTENEKNSGNPPPNLYDNNIPDQVLTKEFMQKIDKNQKNSNSGSQENNKNQNSPSNYNNNHPYNNSNSYNNGNPYTTYSNHPKQDIYKQNYPDDPYNKNRSYSDPHQNNFQHSHPGFYQNNIHPNNPPYNPNFNYYQSHNYVNEKKEEDDYLKKQILLNTTLINEQNAFLRDLLMKDKNKNNKDYDDLKDEIKNLRRQLLEKNRDKIEIQVNIPERENKISLDNKYQFNMDKGKQNVGENNHNSLNKHQNNSFNRHQNNDFNSNDFAKNDNNLGNTLLSSGEHNNFNSKKKFNERKENNFIESERIPENQIENLKNSKSKNKNAQDKNQKEINLNNYNSFGNPEIKNHLESNNKEHSNKNNQKNEKKNINNKEDKDKNNLERNSKKNDNKKNKNNLNEDNNNLDKNKNQKKNSEIKRPITKSNLILGSDRSFSNDEEIKNEIKSNNKRKSIFKDRLSIVRSLLEGSKTNERVASYDVSSDSNSSNFSNLDNSNLKRSEIENRNGRKISKSFVRERDDTSLSKSFNGISNSILSRRSTNRGKRNSFLNGIKKLRKKLKDKLNKDKDFLDDDKNGKKNRDGNNRNENRRDRKKSDYQIALDKSLEELKKSRRLSNLSSNMNKVKGKNKKGGYEIIEKNNNFNNDNYFVKNNPDGNNNLGRPAYEVIERNNVITNDNLLNKNNSGNKKNNYEVIEKHNIITKDNYLQNNNNLDNKNKPAYEVIERTSVIENDHYINENKNQSPYKIIQKHNIITKDNYINNNNLDNKNKPAYGVIERTSVIDNDHYINENNPKQFLNKIPQNLKNRESYFDGKYINSNLIKKNDLKKNFNETQKKYFMDNIKDNKKMNIEERMNKEKNLEMVLSRFFKKMVVYNSKIEQLKKKIISEKIIKEIFILYKNGNYWNYNSLNLYLKNLGLNFLPTQKKRLFLSICDLDKEKKKIITYKNLLQFLNPNFVRDKSSKKFDTFSNNIIEKKNDRFSQLLDQKKKSLKIKGSHFHLFRRLIIFNLKKIEDLTLMVQYLNQNKLSTLFLLISKIDNFIDEKNLFKFIKKNKGKILKNDIKLIFKEFEFGNETNISFENFESFFNKKIWKIPI